jgi:signal transduction histidine kinase
MPAFGMADTIRRAGYVLKCRIVCFCALIIAAIAALVVVVVIEQREAALDRAQGDAANLSAAFEEQVRRVLDNVSGAMELLAQRIKAEGSGFDLADWTKQAPELAASTVQVAIIGADGRLLTTTLDQHPKPIDLSDREHFRVHRDNPNVGLFIGKPVRGRVSGIVTIQVTKRLNKPDGSFAGVLVFSLDPEFLTGLHKKINLGQKGSIALIGKTDTVIRARFTTTENLSSSLIGRAVPNARALRDSAYATAGGFVLPSVIDGVTRVFQWRTVTGYPLVVVVGLGKEEALATANRHARMMLILGAAAIALPLIMAAMLNREISRRVDREIALEAESEKLRAANDGLLAQTTELQGIGAALAAERLKLQLANAGLQFAKAQAEDASRAKSSFLANMSHELRTPLNAIIGFAEIIRDRIFGDDLPRYSDCAADIQVSGVHLLNIINGVLDVAKIESGKFELSETVVTLSDIIASSLPLVTPQAANGLVEFVVDVPEDGTALLCDETQFKQIVINLLSNAIKFTPPGGAITVSAEHGEHGGIRLSIADTGIGMSREEIASALELFHQVDSRLARRFQGTGLGLPLAVQLTALHGGTLQLESTPDVGTVATVHIPAARVIRSRDASQTARDEEERRKGGRHPVTHVVFVQSDRQQFRTRTVDLSETGVRLEQVGSFNLGDHVRVDLGAHTAEGIVVWQRNGDVGVKFLTGDALPLQGNSLDDAA